MAELLEKRVDNLEKELADLKSIVGARDVKKDWLGTFGTAKDDPEFEEMIRLGREHRRNQREGPGCDEDAGS